MIQIGKATITSQNVPATSLDNVLDNLGRVKDGEPLKQFEWDESMRHKDDDSVHIVVNPGQLSVEEMTLEMRDQLRRARGGQAL